VDGLATSQIFSSIFVVSTKEACASPSRGWIEDTDDALSLLTELNSAQELRIEEMRFIHDDIDCKMRSCDACA
jgi:hypothetical protein